jgi:hypothetical protein
VNVTAATLERELLAKLREILVELAWPVEFLAEPKGFDALVRLRTSAGRPPVLLVECKADLRPAAFPSWAQPRTALAEKQRATPVLGLPFVSPRMAELCRATGWSWFDLSGNCRIDVPGRVHIERSGNEPIRRAPRPGANLSTPAAGRLLRALLSPGHAGWTWKHRHFGDPAKLFASKDYTAWPHIEGDTNVSIGLVNKVVRHLVDQGFVEESDEGVRVSDFSGLLAAWRAAYRFDRHERRSYFTLLKGDALRAALHKVALGAADAAVYAAFSAAERQAPNVRQPRTWVYVRPPYQDALVQYAEAKEVDSGENLVVLLPEDSGVFLSFDADSFVGEQTIGCTDPVQTYVDLVHAGGRGEEAAQALLEQRILPAWKAGGAV